MRKIMLYIMMVFMLATMTACDKAIDGFNNSTNYIYFDPPFQLDRFGGKTTKRVDSIVYSFAMDDPSIKEYTFKIPVKTVGLVGDKDRSYRIVVDEKGTTATNDDWDVAALSKGVVGKGSLVDSFRVTVKRQKIQRSVTFCLVANENFQLGAYELLKVKISFSDILQVPTWWNNWEGYLGVFSKEKYAKWQEFYYLGADPNPERFGPNTGRMLSWELMPYYVNREWYPVTFMYISKLKQYFIDNAVYPDGDTSKPRITLP